MIYTLTRRMSQYDYWTRMIRTWYDSFYLFYRSIHLSINVLYSNTFRHKSQPLEIKRTDRLPKRPIFQVFLKEYLQSGNLCELEIDFHSQIWEGSEALFKSSYTNEHGVKVYVWNVLYYIRWFPFFIICFIRNYQDIFRNTKSSKSCTENLSMLWWAGI